MITVRIRASESLALLCVLAACSTDIASKPRTGTTTQRIIGGTASIAAQNAVVLVVHPFASGFEACSGTMLTPRLVLTARHCLARSSATVACTSRGEPVNGFVSRDFEPESLLVFGGMDRPDRQEDTATPSSGARIFDDGAATLCNHDIGLLLLDEPVAGTSIAPIRLDRIADVGEEVTVVGWGTTDRSSIPLVRQQRAGVRVLGVGLENGLGSSEFAISEGPCEGDSGGPAFATSGAIVGSSSRGGNDTEASGPAACRDSVNIYTSASGFKPLILSAYEEAGQEPWLEGQPNPLLAKGDAPCAADGECQSNACSPASHTCVSPVQASPSEDDMGGSGGCATSGARRRLRPDGALALTLALAGVAIGARRRSRRRAQARQVQLALA